MRALFVGIALSLGLIVFGGLFWANLPSRDLFSLLNWSLVQAALESGQTNLWWLSLHGVVIAGLISAISVLIVVDSGAARVQAQAAPAPADPFMADLRKAFGREMPPPAPTRRSSAPERLDPESSIGAQIGFIVVLIFTLMIAFIVGFGGIAGGIVAGVAGGVLGSLLNAQNRAAGLVIGACIGVGMGVGLSVSGIFGGVLGAIIGFGSLLSIGLGVRIQEQRKRYQNLRGSGWIAIVSTIVMLIPLLSFRPPNTDSLALTIAALESTLTAQVGRLTATAEQTRLPAIQNDLTATSAALAGMQQALQQTQTALSVLLSGAAPAPTRTASPAGNLSVTQIAMVRDLATAIVAATNVAQEARAIAESAREGNVLALFAEFLRDPIFQGIGAILALIALVVTMRQGSR